MVWTPEKDRILRRVLAYQNYEGHNSFRHLSTPLPSLQVEDDWLSRAAEMHMATLRVIETARELPGSEREELLTSHFGENYKAKLQKEGFNPETLRYEQQHQFSQ